MILRHPPSRRLSPPALVVVPDAFVRLTLLNPQGLHARPAAQMASKSLGMRGVGP